MSNSNGQNVHPHVTIDPSFLSTPARRRYRPASPAAEEEGLDSIFNFTESRPLTLLDIDVRNGVRQYPPAMPPPDNMMAGAMAQIPITEMTLEQRLLHLTQLAEEQNRQMTQVREFANSQTEALKASRDQLDRQAQQLYDSQQQVSQLTTAFEALSTQPRPLSAPKKKPELPPFDSKNILIWIRRIEAAYTRVGVTEASDKFAWLESMFQVGLNPRIDGFLYGTNTADDWTAFISYLKEEYGPTKRQKAQKLMAENNRHDQKPSQFLAQLTEDVKGVEVDDILKEHLLRTIPPRIREIMGKEVDSKTAKEVAELADEYFDRQGRPLEKSSQPINNVNNASSTLSSTASSTASSTSFTHAFVDDDTDINFVKRGSFRGNSRGNSRGRSRSRPPFSKPNASSTSSNASAARPQPQPKQLPPGACRFHRRFGDNANKCVSDCPLFKSFNAQQQKQQGNGVGGRRQ